MGPEEFLEEFLWGVQCSTQGSTSLGEYIKDWYRMVIDNIKAVTSTVTLACDNEMKLAVAGKWVEVVEEKRRSASPKSVADFI